MENQITGFWLEIPMELDKGWIDLSHDGLENDLAITILW